MQREDSSFISAPVAILIGALMVSISILISGGVIKIKGIQNTKTTTTTNTTVTGSTPEEKLTSMVVGLGLDEDKFKSCFADKSKEGEIDKDINDANAAGPSGTPTFYIGKSNSGGTIDGTQIEGAYPYTRFQEIIDAIMVGNPVPKQKDESGTEVENKVAKVSLDDDPVLGDKNAQVTIVEFSDYECPFCKRHFTQTYPSIKKDYIDTGKAKLVYRDLIAVPSHNPWATQAAHAANCVKEQGGDEAYFKFHDEYYTKTAANGQGI